MSASSQACRRFMALFTRPVGFLALSLALGSMGLSETALARPVAPKTPIRAGSADNEVLALGIDLGRFRTPDLRRIEPDLTHLLAKELEESGYSTREYEGDRSTDGEGKDP